MHPSSIRSEGTNLLKDINNLNRRTKQGVLYGMSNQKPKPATSGPNIYTNTTSNFKTNAKSRLAPTANKLSPSQAYQNHPNGHQNDAKAIFGAPKKSVSAIKSIYKQGNPVPSSNDRGPVRRSPSPETSKSPRNQSSQRMNSANRSIGMGQSRSTSREKRHNIPRHILLDPLVTSPGVINDKIIVVPREFDSEGIVRGSGKDQFNLSDGFKLKSEISHSNSGQLSPGNKKTESDRRVTLNSSRGNMKKATSAVNSRKSSPKNSNKPDMNFEFQKTTAKNPVPANKKRETSPKPPTRHQTVKSDVQNHPPETKTKPDLSSNLIHNKSPNFGGGANMYSKFLKGPDAFNTNPHGLKTAQQIKTGSTTTLKNVYDGTNQKIDTQPKKINPMANLTEEEKQQYGDRFPTDYLKIDFLGRGGFALVWLGKDKESGKQVAVKQILKNNVGDDSQKKEIYYGQKFFNEGGESKEEFAISPGIRHIAGLIGFKSTKLDNWHIQELGGSTLSKLIFEIKGEFYKGERIYGVKHQPLYLRFRDDDFSLKILIKQIAESLHLLASQNIVHCDLKPDNILIDMKSNFSEKSFDLKIIDFGSAFDFKGKGHLGMATPEYMPPEFLHILHTHVGGNNSVAYLSEMSHPWSVDVWSLGAIILEIITGVPLWMSLKCRVEIFGQDYLKMGLFAVKGRTYDKILQKQKSVMENFSDIMGDYMRGWREPDMLYDLLARMLTWDPLERISPEKILKHPYLAKVVGYK